MHQIIPLKLRIFLFLLWLYKFYDGFCDQTFFILPKKMQVINNMATKFQLKLKTSLKWRVNLKAVLRTILLIF